MRRLARLAAILPGVVFGVLSCRAPPLPPAPPPALAWPGPAAGERFGIDDQASQVLILVYRDGPMAALGHNHVIAVRQLSGDIVLAPDPSHSRFDLVFPVAALDVDAPQLRAQHGPDFDGVLDAGSIAGTRAHMLGPALLDATHFPAVELHSQRVRSSADGLQVDTRISVRAGAALVEIPLTLTRSGDVLEASGEFDLTHGQLGLTPYSVAMGALRVAERMHIEFRLRARRQPMASERLNNQ